MNRDFVEMLSALSEAGADHLVSGVGFDEAWKSRKIVRIGEFDVAVLGRDALLRNKRASGRPKDLADVAWLESGEAGPGHDAQ